jgi:SAM-dependent methyltransferase
MTPNFVSVTEISGDDVTQEQVERLARRYYWAADYCRGKDVLEVACGAAQGLGYLASVARSVNVGDYCRPLLDIARQHYNGRFRFLHFDAHQLPFADASFDVVLICEALYYLADVDRFFLETRRVLRPGGTLLVVTANKDLFDFNPSPYSTRYLGVVELRETLARHGFAAPQFFGDTPVGAASGRQRLLRPVKAVAARLGLIPKSMRGKKLLKKLVFGGLVKMPSEITGDTARRVPVTTVPAGSANRDHKVILCAAVLRN